MAGGMVTRGKTRGKVQSQAQAQTQAQKVREVTKVDSLELIRCLLKVSVNEICFLRGLFPDDCFNGVNLQHLEGMHLQTLKSTDPQAQRVLQWLDEGVQDAVEKMYLKTMMFGLAADAEGHQLLEEYMFNFSYNKDGGVAMEVGSKSSIGSPFKSADMESIRYQVCRLIRTLVQICRTLEKVPEDRFIFMKITYYDWTPADYEPPYFRSDATQSCFMRRPFHMQVGSVATAYHAVGLRVKSVLDSSDYGDADEPMLSEGHSSCLPSSLTGGSAAKMTAMQPLPAHRTAPSHLNICSKPAGVQVAEDSQNAPDSQIAPTVQAPPNSGARSDTTCDAEADEQYASIKQYCLHRKQVDLTDAMAQFPAIQVPKLKRLFEHLVQDGVLEKQCNAGRSAFQVCNKDALVPSGLQTAQSNIPQMEDIDSQEANAGMGGHADIIEATRAKMQALNAADSSATHRTRHSSGAICQGSENTCSNPAQDLLIGSAQGATAPDLSGQPKAGIVFDSQQSGQKKRKASMVEELICQRRTQAKEGKPTTSRSRRLSNMSH